MTITTRSPTGYCRKGVYLAEPQELVDLVDENTVLLVGILGTVSCDHRLALRLVEADIFDKHPRPTRVDTKTSKRSTSCSPRRTRRPVSTLRCMCKFSSPRLLRRSFIRAHRPRLSLLLSDAASGGFVTPFVNEKLVWDFRLPLVTSINASGHKVSFGTLLDGPHCD